MGKKNKKKGGNPEKQIRKLESALQVMLPPLQAVQGVEGVKGYVVPEGSVCARVDFSRMGEDYGVVFNGKTVYLHQPSEKLPFERDVPKLGQLPDYIRQITNIITNHENPQNFQNYDKK